MNAKTSTFLIYVEAIMLLYDLHDCTFDGKNLKTIETKLLGKIGENALFMPSLNFFQNLNLNNFAHLKICRCKIFEKSLHKKCFSLTLS